MHKKVFIIAEAGVNHNSSLKLAKQMVDAAIKSGADAIKFQSFVPELLVGPKAAKAAYQGKSGRQLQMLKRLALNQAEQKELLFYCQRNKIMFLSSPFEQESVSFLASLGLKIFKIPSGEITNLPYLRQIGALKRDVILSTGMSTLKEVAVAMKVLVKAGLSKNKITLLHCTTEYPAPIDEVNLLAMRTLREVFKVRVGYSDHTVGLEIALAAVALGAEVIEKHFTLSRKLKGPDHQASLEPDELTKLVKGIRNIELALGNGQKKPSCSELKNLKVVRKSIFAARNISRGQLISAQDLIVRRPAGGISPMKWDQIVGSKAKKDFATGEALL